MTALHWSRRRLLGVGAVALTTSVAGCSGETGRSRSDASDEPTPPGIPDNAITDFEVRTLRSDRGVPLVTTGDDDSLYIFVLDADDADDLTFERELEGTDEVRAFLAETNYEEESVVVYQSDVGECYRRRHEYVEIDAESFDARFCWVLRDATVPCDADERNGLASFVRIPYAYESRPSHAGASSGSTCREEVAARMRSEEDEDE